MFVTVGVKVLIYRVATFKLIAAIRAIQSQSLHFIGPAYSLLPLSGYMLFLRDLSESLPGTNHWQVVLACRGDRELLGPMSPTVVVPRHPVINASGRAGTMLFSEKRELNALAHVCTRRRRIFWTVRTHGLAHRLSGPHWGPRAEQQHGYVRFKSTSVQPAEWQRTDLDFCVLRIRIVTKRGYYGLCARDAVFLTRNTCTERSIVTVGE